MKKIIILSYIIILILFSLFTYLFIDPNFIYLKSLFTNFYNLNRQAVSLIYIGFIISFFLFYLIFFKLVSKNLLSKKELFFLIGSSAVILLFAYPAMLSFDIFNYIATAKVTFFYHENPYLIMPIQFTGDPVLLFTHAANKVALYGPLWILITGVPFLLGVGNYLLTLLNFKILVLVFYFLSCFLVYKLSDKSLKVLVLFALNPLVLIETLASGHNDIVMVVLVLGSLYLIKKRVANLFLYLLSILIKYSTIFLLPVYIFIALRKKVDLKRVFLYTAIFMLIIFFLSPLREELYPWYAVWFLPFLILYSLSKRVLFFIGIFTFALLLTYVPFMYIGQYSNITLYSKTAIILLPLIIWTVSILFNKLRLKLL
jgi:hypothetical protein